MATRLGLLEATFESTPEILAVVAEILEEVENIDPFRLSSEFVAELDARVEGLSWAPPQDQRQKLLLVAVSAVSALAATEAE